MAGSLLRTAVSVVIFEPPHNRRVLAVLRPDAPGEDFRGMWGLPAATLAPGESSRDGALRIGTQKLGLALEPGRELARGRRDRADGKLEMVLLEARARGWPPELGQPDGSANVTYYTDWSWVEPDALRPAADRGSLCTRLFLEIS